VVRLRVRRGRRGRALPDAARAHLREDQSVRGGAEGQKQGGGGELSHDFGSKTAENCPEARLNKALIACGVGEMSELYSSKVQSSKFKVQSRLRLSATAPRRERG